MMKSRGSRRSSVEPFTITFRNADEVVEFDERCEVPPHDERTSLDTELWILGRYLRALAEASSLTYPVTATHAKESESPDFILTMSGGAQIGLEATEASTPQAHHRYMEGERSPGKAIFRGRDQRSVTSPSASGLPMSAKVYAQKPASWRAGVGRRPSLTILSFTRTAPPASA